MKNKNKNKNALCMVALLSSFPAHAMQPLSEGELSTVSGQDGISVTFSGTQMSASSVEWSMDAGTARESKLALGGPVITAVDANGNTGLTDYNATASFDASATQLGVKLQWDRLRVAFNNILHGTDTTNSLGSYVFDGSGTFQLNGGSGLFNTAATDARLYLEIADANIFYKQGTGNSPEVVFSNFDFLWDMPAGIVGVDSEGILVQGDVNFNLTFDLRYDYAPTTPFLVDAGDSQGMTFGWTGGLQDAQLRVRGGGLWDKTSLTGSAPNASYDQTARTQGLNVGLRWNFEPTFRWVVGEADGFRTSLEFGNWTKLPGAPYGYDFSSITIDAINAGQGGGGLCWGANWSGPATSCEPKGGQYLELPAENNAMAIYFRDAKLPAYSTSVTILDAPNPNVTYNWALIYTWGDIDANFHVYPGSADGSSNTGMHLDLVVTNQTFDTNDADGDGNIYEQGFNWAEGTHFMIGDTDAQMGIGFLNSNFLMVGKDVDFALTSGATGGMNLNSSQVRLAMNGLFGGGTLPNLDEVVKAAGLNVNFEFDQFDLTVFPHPTDTALAYDATVNFANTNIAGFSHDTSGGPSDDGSFFALSEPSKPDTDIRLADIRGTLGFRNGSMSLVGANETAPGLPAKLVISNDIHIGTSVAGGSALEINRVEFGNRSLGKVVVPAGQWYSEISLSPQY